MKQSSSRPPLNQIALWSRFELVDRQAQARTTRAHACAKGAGILNVSGRVGLWTVRNPGGTKRPVRCPRGEFSQGKATLLAKLALTWLEC